MYDICKSLSYNHYNAKTTVVNTFFHFLPEIFAP